MLIFSASEEISAVFYRFWHAEFSEDKQTDRQTDKQTDRLAGRQTDGGSDVKMVGDCEEATSEHPLLRFLSSSSHPLLLFLACAKRKLGWGSEVSSAATAAAAAAVHHHHQHPSLPIPLIRILTKSIGSREAAISAQLFRWLATANSFEIKICRC